MNKKNSSRWPKITLIIGSKILKLKKKLLLKLQKISVMLEEPKRLRRLLENTMQ